MKKFLYTLATPPGKWFHFAVLAVVLMGCYFGAFLGQVPNQFRAATALSLMAISALWVIRLFLYVWSFENPDFAPKKTAWKRWFIAPAMLVAAYFLIALSVPVWVAFLLNLPALNRFAATVQHVPNNTTLPSQWVGFYQARGLIKARNGVQFWVNRRAASDTPLFYLHYFPNTSADFLNSHITHDGQAIQPLLGGWYYSVEFAELPKSQHSGT